jgi:hypothetical protein
VIELACWFWRSLSRKNEENTQQINITNIGKEKEEGTIIPNTTHHTNNNNPPYTFSFLVHLS